MPTAFLFCFDMREGMLMLSGLQLFSAMFWSASISFSPEAELPAELPVGRTDDNPLGRLVEGAKSTTAAVGGATKATVTTISTNYLDDQLADSRYIIVLSSRQAAHMLAASAELPRMLEKEPIRIEAAPAPAPRDAYWPNLLAPRFWRMVYRAAAGVGISALFLFWTIPVAFVQSLASLSNLAKAFPFLQGFVDHLEESGSLTLVENTLSAFILVGLRAATLNSGLFQWTARLGGALRHSDIQAKSTGLMMLFQLLMVLLASIIASSLFDTLDQILREPTKLPQLLAKQLPSQSVFFLNYINTSATLMVLLDMCRGLQLFYLACGTCCGACCFKLATDNNGDYKLGYVYARVVLLMQIGIVFLFIAPLVATMSFLALGMMALIFAKLLRHVQAPPVVDTAGKLWEQAIVYEGYGFILAQLLLIGVLVNKMAFIEAAFVAILTVFTIWRVVKLRNTWGRKARTLPLRTCIELDAAGKPARGASNLAADLAPYSRGGVPAVGKGADAKEA